MDWRSKVSAALTDLQAALSSRGASESIKHLHDAETNVLAAIDALDDARANEAT